MKTYSLIIALILSISTFAAKGGSEKIYNTLEAETDGFSMSLSKSMIDFFDLDIDFNGKEKWITGDFAKGRMLVVQEKFNASDIKKMFRQEGFEMVNLEEEENIEIEDGDVDLYVIRNGNKVSEAHFIIEGDDKVVLFSIYGDMKVSEKN